MSNLFSYKPYVNKYTTTTGTIYYRIHQVVTPQGHYIVRPEVYLKKENAQKVIDKEIK